MDEQAKQDAMRKTVAQATAVQIPLDNEESVPGIYYGIETDTNAYDGYDVAGLFDQPLDATETWGLISALHYGIRAGRKTADPTRDLEKMRDVLGVVLDHRAARTGQ